MNLKQHERNLHLYEFFGAYFHQDWSIEHDTADQVLEAFRKESDEYDCEKVLEELRVLLSQENDELVLRQYLLKDLSCYFSYWNEWDSGKSWLRHIERKLQETGGR